MKKSNIFIIFVSIILIVSIVSLSNHFFAQNELFINSGIKGTVNYGPVTPVCRIGVPCYKPYTGKLIVMTTDRSNTIKSIISDENGRFSIPLNEGVYIVVIDMKFKNECLKIVKVNKNQYSYINLQCDTGIR